MNNNEVKTLNLREHIRLRPSMYIGKPGNGSEKDDGIYILLKEIIDNSIDEIDMNVANEISVKIQGDCISIRDFGKGIDFSKLEQVCRNPNSLMKIKNNKSTRRTIGLYAIGLSVVCSLSSEMKITSYQEGFKKSILMSRGKIQSIERAEKSDERSGLLVSFIPDKQIFGDVKYNLDYIREKLSIYSFCFPGLRLRLNGEIYYSPNGMLEILDRLIDDKEENKKFVRITDSVCDIAIAKSKIGSVSIKSFVNGHPTPWHGTHVTALINNLYSLLKKNASKRILKCDVPAMFSMCINIQVKEPLFCDSLKYELASKALDSKSVLIEQYLTKLFHDNSEKFMDFIL